MRSVTFGAEPACGNNGLVSTSILLSSQLIKALKSKIWYHPRRPLKTTTTTTTRPPPPPPPTTTTTTTTTNQQPTIYKQQTTNKQQPTTNNDQQTTTNNKQQPTTRTTRTTRTTTHKQTKKNKSNNKQQQQQQQSQSGEWSELPRDSLDPLGIRQWFVDVEFPAVYPWRKQMWNGHGRRGQATCHVARLKANHAEPKKQLQLGYWI